MKVAFVIGILVLAIAPSTIAFWLRHRRTWIILLLNLGALVLPFPLYLSREAAAFQGACLLGLTTWALLPLMNRSGADPRTHQN